MKQLYKKSFFYIAGTKFLFKIHDRCIKTEFCNSLCILCIRSFQCEKIRRKLETNFGKLIDRQQQQYFVLKSVFLIIHV